MEPSLFRRQEPPASPPILFQVSVAPNITVNNSNNPDRLAGLLAGVVLGLAAALLLGNTDEHHRP